MWGYLGWAIPFQKYAAYFSRFRGGRLSPKKFAAIFSEVLEGGRLETVIEVAQVEIPAPAVDQSEQLHPGLVELRWRRAKEWERCMAICDEVRLSYDEREPWRAK